jgi:PIN domain nuclease of toxin-antitoxin system
MNIIIDTHIFLWILNDPSKIDKTYFQYIKDTNNNIYLSSISMVELIIKASIGKLNIDFNIKEMAEEMGIKIISFNANDALQLSKLPLHHKDPFDRMIIAQTISNHYFLISDDSKFTLYIVNELNLL